MLLFGYHKEFIFKERGFFKISQNKNPSKITCYMVDEILEMSHTVDTVFQVYCTSVGRPLADVHLV